jgi:hypothetical protein
MSYTNELVAVRNIPPHFYETEFNLKLPSIFSMVVEDNESTHLSLVRKGLQKKLHALLDSVELNLWEHISSKATLIYKSLRVVVAVQVKISLLLDSLVYAKAKASSVRSNSVTKPLFIVAKKLRLKRLGVVSERLRAITSIVSTERYVLRSLKESRNACALDQIIKIKQVLSQGFEDLYCVKQLQRKMEKYAKIAVATLNRTFLQEALKYAQEEHLGDEKLRQTIKEIVELKILNSSLSSLKMAFSKSIFSVWITVTKTYADMGIGGSKAEYPQSDFEENKDCIGKCTRILRRIHHVQFEELLVILIDHLLVVLKNSTKVYNFVLACLMENSVKIVTETGADTCHDDHKCYQEMVTSAVSLLFDMVENSLILLFRERKNKNSELSVNSIEKIVGAVTNFVSCCRDMYGKNCLKLETSMKDLANSSFQLAHERSLSKLLRVLDSEKWKVSPVTSTAQRIILAICSNSNVLKIYDSEGIRRAAPNNKKIYLNGKSYFVPSSLLTFLYVLDGHIKYACAFPTLANDVYSKLAIVLQVFNQRLKQLVLGGGSFALRVVKSITIKHLILVSQCLDLVYALIPFIKAFLVAHRCVLLKDLDRTSAQYRLHKENVFEKCVDIVLSRIKKSGRLLLEHTWDMPVVPGELKMSPCMSKIIEDLQATYKTILSLLVKGEAVEIFSRLVGKLSGFLWASYTIMSLTA